MNDVGLDPGLVMALAQLFTTQSRAAESNAWATRSTTAAVGLDAGRTAELDLLALRWTVAADTLRQRALLAAGFRVALPSVPVAPRTNGSSTTTATFRQGVVDHAALLVGDSAIDGFDSEDLAAIAAALAMLSDTELRAWWSELDERERRALVARLATDTSAGELLALIARGVSPDHRPVDGRLLLSTLATWLPLVEVAASGSVDGELTFDELSAIEAGALPDWLDDLVGRLAASPVWFTNVALALGDARITTPLSTSVLRGVGAVTAADLDEARLLADIADLLIDPAVFDRLDAAKNGRIDGRVSAEDLRLAVSEGWFDAEATALLLALSESGRLGLVERADDRAIDQSDRRGTLHWTDVVALGANLHAWGDDPDRTRQVLQWLPHAHDRIAGADGLDVRLVSDDAVRSLATAGLTGIDDLVEQTLVVAALPESRGGERNRLITAWYSMLALEMNDVLNHRLSDPMDPSLHGHSGANWMLMAPWASNSLRPQLIGDPLLDVFLARDSVTSASVGDRQQLADGNQYIFGYIAPRYAAFVDRWRHGPVTDPEELATFFADDLPDGRAMFGPGHDQLRGAFAAFAAAAAEQDPALRQELTFTANALVAVHEQAGVQPQLDALTDLSISDDGILKGLFGELLPGGDALWATSFITLSIGHGADTTEIEIDRDLDPARFDHTNNRLIGTDLTTDLDPDRTARVEVGTTSVSWNGSPADVRLESLGGWSAPPAGSGMEAFPTSSRTWFERGTNNVVVFPGSHPPVHEDPGSTDGRDLRGTAAFDWGDPADRMWNIANLFHQTHTDPVLWERQHEVGIDRVDDGRPAFDWLPDEAVERLSRRSPRG